MDSSQGSTSPSVAAASPLLVHDGCGAAQTLTPAAPCFQFSPDDAGSQARAPVLAESGVVPGEPPEDAHIEPAASACGGLASCARSSASCLEPGFGGEQSMLTSDSMEAAPDQSVLVGGAYGVAGAPDRSTNFGWKRRPRGPPVPDERPPSVGRVPALESSLHGFANRQSEVIVNPTMGTVFDSLPEAYEFYNLYSWESGFGIRYGKSRQNVRGSKCMHEIVCGSAVSTTIPA